MIERVGDCCRQQAVAVRVAVRVAVCVAVRVAVSSACVNCVAVRVGVWQCVAVCCRALQGRALVSRVIFCKSATDHRALLQKMTYADKASYDSTALVSRVHTAVEDGQYSVKQSCAHFFRRRCAHMPKNAVNPNQLKPERKKCLFLTSEKLKV